jgi:hypothetical protein
MSNNEETSKQENEGNKENHGFEELKEKLEKYTDTKNEKHTNSDMFKDIELNYQKIINFKTISGKPPFKTPSIYELLFFKFYKSNYISPLFELFHRNSKKEIQTNYSFTQRIADVQDTTYINKPIMLVGHLEEIDDQFSEEIEFFTINYEFVYYTTILKFRIADKFGNSIETEEIPIEIIPNFSDLRKYDQLLFMGTIKDDGDCFKFVVLHVDYRIKPIYYIGNIGMSYDELGKKVRHYHNQDGLRNYIKDTVVKNIGIKGLDDAIDLNKAIDFMIIQSFSNGMSFSNRYSNKLHSLVIGPPASGKKLLTMIAKSINPIFEEITSTPRKVTPAGLIGRVITKNNMVYSKPGILPNNSGGLVAIQDFHEIATREGKYIYPVFSLVMESGVVDDSTSAHYQHQAITSIHLDMNRISQVNPTAEIDYYSDLGIPKNIISRFDFIIDIPADLNRNWDVLFALIMGTELGRFLGTENESKTVPEWSSLIKKFVSYTLSEYTYSTIPPELNKIINERFEQLKKENELFKSKNGDGLNDMLLRIQISVDKMLKALACSDLTKQTTPEHIDIAFDFLSYKLEFLNNFGGVEVPITFNKTKRERMEEVKEIIMGKCTGKSLNLNEIWEEIKEDIGLEISLATLRRRLDEMIKEPKFDVSHKHDLFTFGSVKKD